MEELKKCPFCDGEAEVLLESYAKAWHVWCQCKNCGVKTAGRYINLDLKKNTFTTLENDAEIVIKDWNRRVNDND